MHPGSKPSTSEGQASLAADRLDRRKGADALQRLRPAGLAILGAA